MKYRYISLLCLLCCIGMSHWLQAQVETDCNPLEGLPVAKGEVNFIYGTTTNAFSNINKSDIVVGQPLVGSITSQPYTSEYGIWALLRMPPQAPSVMASQGDFPDRVLITWSEDPLGPTSSGGFIVLRDDAYLTSIDPGISQFIDFNVQAGEFYEYKVIGKNTFGDGVPGMSVGFVNPNGVVTGKIETNNGNPVIGAIVTLTPTVGRSLEFDGIGDYVCISHSDALPTDMFTVSAWIKIGDTHDSDGIIDLGSDLNKNFWIHTTPAGMGKGVVVGVGDGTAHEITHEFVDADPADPINDPDEWNHVTAVYGGGTLILYVNGRFITSMQAPIDNEDALFSLGSRRDQTGFLDGYLDEVRIYDRLLTQTEIITTKDITVPSNTDGLVAYWKFDEGLGEKVFDLTSNNMDGRRTGTLFSGETPKVLNAGITDGSGFYSIEGINYSVEQSFTATPTKNFYNNFAIEFNAAYQGCATLTNFDLPDTSHIEISVHPFDLDTKQSILSKVEGGTDAFNLFVENGKYNLTLNGQTQELGNATAEYQHLALSIDGSANTVKYYLNGTLVGTFSYTNVTGAWNAEEWQLGARDVTTPADFFTGLVDEVAFYQDSLLSLAEIQLHAATGGTGGTDNGHGNLFSYFDLNEGQGTELTDIGSSLSGIGELKNGSFSIITRIQAETPHEFQPSSKLININPSNTAVGNVDFTDLSTVPISGYVRFENTFCFQKEVEILVDGESFTPPVFTDSEGKFVVEIEPGKDVMLTARFGEVSLGETPHQFFPGFWQFKKVNRPIAGVLFQNQTKREVKGQLAGGYCNKSVIPTGAIVKVKLETLNGCYSETIQLVNPNGKFTFQNVPPDSVTVAVVEHSNPVIYDYFQLQGGSVLDLRTENDSIGFTYFAPPEVELSEIATNACGDAMLNSAQSETVTVKVFESYDGGQCYLDTALLTINNAIDDSDQFDTLMTTGELEYKFKAGFPNIVPPYKKVLQVTAESHDEQDTKTLEAVVLGRRPRETTFATTSPELPTLILRDPPGDGSFAFIEQGTTTCNSVSLSAQSADGSEEEITLNLGLDSETSVGVGAETELEIDVTNDVGFSASTTFMNLTTNTSETCVTTTEVISTSDGDLVVGSNMGGDVYMGGAINYIFGITDELLWDTMSCNYLLDKGLFVFPDGFETTFLYTEEQIDKVVIPNLLTIGDTVSANTWQSFIDLNEEQKNNAVFSKNISFDAGVVYSESETTEVTETVSTEFTVEFSSDFISAYGVNVNGVGLVGGATISQTTSESTNNTNTEIATRTVGYTLADDDFFDNISVNIKKDRAYGTPVFEVESGQTSCPHEPETQPREEVSISADKLVAVNIPENDPAIFKLTLGNISPSEDAGFYTLQLVDESNPNGAMLTAAGEILNAPAVFEVPFGENVEVDMVVERGPAEYVYENLRVSYFSQCEVDRANALGIPSDETDPKFYQELEFDVYYLEPCSSVDLAETLDGWVITPASGEMLFITVNGYDLADTDLELVRVQYRRSQGDGSWINIADIPKAELGGAGFTIVQWNTNGLQDGNYEIRAVTQCFGAQNAGISHIREGKIERTPPEIFGTPEPADGILSAQDEISITFTEEIRCDLLVQADIFNNNNVGLYDATSDELIDATVTCTGDKITIVPNVQNAFIENRLLRVEVDDIKDLADNAFLHADWEFLVDRNPLRWMSFNLDESKFEDEEKTFYRTIANAGGSSQAYTLTNIPVWVEVFPTEGFLAPGETQVITFMFDREMVLGDFADTIIMEGAQGDEPFPVLFRNLCPPPVWEVDAAAFTYSMNFSVELNIQGEISVDKMDIVAAFIDGELRGKAYVEYVPSLDRYEAFLTVYSNDFIDEDVTFQIWDADQCALYGQILESFPFVADELVGTPNEPQVLNTNGLLLREIPLQTGWNWISFNLGFPYPDLDSALVSLGHPENDLVKDQTSFANFYGDPINEWIGSLSELGNISMYQYRADTPDTIFMVGTPIDHTTVDIPIQTGWNWIGYLPQNAMTVDDALASLTALNGDVIKSQTAFAQYVAGFGWIGNLDFMQAPKDYLLKMANPGMLNYPQNVVGEQPPLDGFNAGGGNYSPWTVSPSEFEYTMIAVGFFSENDLNATQEGMTIGAFANEEVRGVSQAIYIEQLDQWMFFLTMYANQSGEQLSFRLHNSYDDSILDLEEVMYFAIDGQAGTVEEPVPFTLGAVLSSGEATDLEGGLIVRPNPFNSTTSVNFRSPDTSEAIVTMSDATGRLIKMEKVFSQKGWNTLSWDVPGLPAGFYFIKVETAGTAMVQKVLVN